MALSQVFSNLQDDKYLCSGAARAEPLTTHEFDPAVSAVCTAEFIIHHFQVRNDAR
jgi:hypothetical protein